VTDSQDDNDQGEGGCNAGLDSPTSLELVSLVVGCFGSVLDVVDGLVDSVRDNLEDVVAVVGPVDQKGCHDGHKVDLGVLEGPRVLHTWHLSSDVVRFSSVDVTLTSVLKGFEVVFLLGCLSSSLSAHLFLLSFLFCVWIKFNYSLGRHFYFFC